MSSTYGIDGFEMEGSFRGNVIVDLIILSISIAITLYIVIMNLFIIVSVLRDPKMRQWFFFRHILFIALAHLLQGVIIIPLHIEAFFNGPQSWTADTNNCIAWYLAELTLVVVITYLFLMMMFERFFSLTYPQIMSSSCLGWLMIISPWLLAAGLVVFLFYTAPFSQVNMFASKLHDSCMWPELVNNIYTAIGFLIPAGFVFGFCWANCLVRCLLRQQYVQNLGVADPRVHTTASSVVALCFVFMCLPANSHLMIPADLQYSNWSVIASYISFGNAALTPTLWLMIPSFRRNCCSCCTPSPRARGGSRMRAMNVDEIHARMLDPEATQPSTTTKL